MADFALITHRTQREGAYSVVSLRDLELRITSSEGSHGSGWNGVSEITGAKKSEKKKAQFCHINRALDVLPISASVLHFGA